MFKKLPDCFLEPKVPVDLLSNHLETRKHRSSLEVGGIPAVMNVEFLQKFP
jgi:hypothetical protein